MSQKAKTLNPHAMKCSAGVSDGATGVTGPLGAQRRTRLQRRDTSDGWTGFSRKSSAPSSRHLTERKRVNEQENELHACYH